MSRTDPMFLPDQILRFCVKLIDWRKTVAFVCGEPCLICERRYNVGSHIIIWCKVASLAQDIKAITSKEFIESHKDQYKNLKDWVETFDARNPAHTEETKPEDNHEKPERVDVSAESETLTIDDLPIKELKKYSTMCDDKVLSFLQANQIKTIGDFRKLTESRARGFAAKGKQDIYKNTLLRILKRKDEILSKIKL